MTRFECTREPELVETIVEGRWPDGCPEELRAHVDSCELCVDVAIVASAIHDDREEAFREADVPASGAVWWRTQRRAQQEAARAAARTMTVVQVATLAATAVVLVQQDWGHWFSRGWYVATDFVAAAHWTPPLVVGIAMCVMLAPVAIYYALAE